MTRKLTTLRPWIISLSCSHLLLLGLNLVAQPAPAYDPGPRPQTNQFAHPIPDPAPSPEASALTNMVMRPVGPGVFEIGKVRLDKTNRRVTFPASVNLRSGPMEYFLVTGYGKVHESILRTQAEPYHIHLAMLLLDAQPGAFHLPEPSPKGAVVNTNAPPRTPGGPIAQPMAMTFTGEKIEIEVSWTSDGKLVRCPADELAFNLAEKKPMTRGSWIYNGSVIMDGSFMAQRDGSIITIINDPFAMVNNDRRGSENDDIWTTNTNRVPAINTPVEVTFKLEPRTGRK